MRLFGSKSGTYHSFAAAPAVFASYGALEICDDLAQHRTHSRSGEFRARFGNQYGTKQTGFRVLLIVKSDRRLESTLKSLRIHGGIGTHFLAHHLRFLYPGSIRCDLDVPRGFRAVRRRKTKATIAVTAAVPMTFTGVAHLALFRLRADFISSDFRDIHSANFGSTRVRAVPNRSRDRQIKRERL
jgi:hypothetical protein